MEIGSDLPRLAPFGTDPRKHAHDCRWPAGLAASLAVDRGLACAHFHASRVLGNAQRRAPPPPRAVLFLAPGRALPPVLLGPGEGRKEGPHLDGRLEKVAKRQEHPPANGPRGPATITFVDNDLYRTSVPQSQIAAVNQVN